MSPARALPGIALLAAALLLTAGSHALRERRVAGQPDHGLRLAVASLLASGAGPTRDLPGEDLPGIPRPPGGVRLASSSLGAGPSRVRAVVYRAPITEAQARAAYGEALTGSGWTEEGAVQGTGRAFLNDDGSRLVLIVQPAGPGHSYVGLVLGPGGD